MDLMRQEFPHVDSTDREDRCRPLPPAASALPSLQELPGEKLLKIRDSGMPSTDDPPPSLRPRR